MPVQTTITAPKAAEAVQPSIGEQLSSFGHTAWGHLMQLDARETGINVLLSAAVVVLALGALWSLRLLFDRWVLRLLANSPHPDDSVDGRPPKVAGVTWALLRLAVLTGAVLWVMSVWGIDPWTWITGEAGVHLMRLVLIVVLVTALVEVAGFVIRRVIEGFATRSRDARRAAQLRTLGPLLTGSAQGILIVVGLLTFLSEVGVKVGPLLASAGVVGIAVGFGAQTLVKDFLTGLFLIAEDVVSVGDNIRIADASGRVEAMTLRTIRLRDADGTLHIFPYSEAQVVHNRTKDFSAYLFEMVLAYTVDVDRALALMAEVGEALRQDPEFGPLITKPFEVLGVDKLLESGMTLKGRIVTKPLSQWRVGREYNRRIKAAFDAEGIGAPYTSVQIMPPDLVPETEGDQEAAREPRAVAPPQNPRPI